MNYAKQAWNNLPHWAKVVSSSALTMGVLINVGNGLIAKHELNKGYTAPQAEENLKGRLGQYLPYGYDQLTFSVGTPTRKLVYRIFD